MIEPNNSPAADASLEEVTARLTDIIRCAETDRSLLPPFDEIKELLEIAISLYSNHIKNSAPNRSVIDLLKAIGLIIPRDEEIKYQLEKYCMGGNEYIETAFDLQNFLTKHDSSILINMLYPSRPGHMVAEIDNFLRMAYLGDARNTLKSTIIFPDNNIGTALHKLYRNLFDYAVVSNTLMRALSYTTHFLRSRGIDVGLGGHRVTSKANKFSVSGKHDDPHLLLYKIFVDDMRASQRQYMLRRLKSPEYNPLANLPAPQSSLLDFLEDDGTKIALVLFPEGTVAAGVNICTPDCFVPALIFLRNAGYKLVFIGRSRMPPQFAELSVKDYANSGSASFENDLHLSKLCSLVLGLASGITHAAAIFGKPLVFVNSVDWILSAYGHSTVIVPQLVIEKATGRTLSFDETVHLRLTGFGKQDLFPEELYLRRPAEADEILAATEEADRLGADQALPLTTLQAEFRHRGYFGPAPDLAEVRISQHFVERHRHLLPPADEEGDNPSDSAALSAPTPLMKAQPRILTLDLDSQRSGLFPRWSQNQDHLDLGNTPSIVSGQAPIRDLFEEVSRSGSSTEFDVVIVRASMGSTAPIGNLKAFRCPTVLCIDDTQCGTAPLSTAIEIASGAGADCIVSAECRHHLHWFSAAGFERLAWFPSLSLGSERKISSTGPTDQTRIPRFVDTGRGRKFEQALSDAGLAQLATGTADGKLIIHGSANGELSHRFFALVKQGACLLTDRLSLDSGLSEMWRDGGDIFTYDTAEELVDKARYLLAHPTLMSETAQKCARRWSKFVAPLLAGQNLADWALGGKIDYRWTAKSDDRGARPPDVPGMSLRSRIRTYEAIQAVSETGDRVNGLVHEDLYDVVATDCRDLRRLHLVKPYNEMGNLQWTFAIDFPMDDLG